jgi:hypothetical protein
MKKIELTPKTIGTVMNLLQQATAGQFLRGYAHDKRPLQIKNFDFDRDSIDSMAKVQMHWMYVKGEGEVSKHKLPLLHLIISATCTPYFSYGDVFYFKGKQIIIDKKGQYDINSLTSEHHRSVESILVVKYAKDLSAEDKDMAEEVKAQAELDAEYFDREYWEPLERDLDDDLDLGLNEDDFELQAGDDFNGY